MTKGTGLGRLLFQRLSRELRAGNGKKKYQDDPAYQYILRQFKDHKVTSATFCKAEQEMMLVGQTYLCLLESLRKSEELLQRYKSSERSVEESANLVGLKLPPRH